MNKQLLNWLHQELPELVDRGVVPAEVADRIRQHYGKMDAKAGRQWAVVVFGILGASLIGLGLILLLAHNWESLGRPMRTALSFLPLIIAQTLGFFVSFRLSNSPAWRESTGMFWVLSIGASIALVSQTYHLSGDAATFLLTWSILALPIIYVLNSSSAAMMYWIGITAWIGSFPYWEHQSHWKLLYWPLMALAVPHLIQSARPDRYRSRIQWLLWLLSICGIFGVGYSLPYRLEKLWIVAYSGYFASLYLVGWLWVNQSNRTWQRPLQSVGLIGLIAVAVAMTFEQIWTEYYNAYVNSVYLWTILVTAAWPCIAIVLWGIACQRQQIIAALFGALPLFALLGFGLTTIGGQTVTVLIMNFYLFALGVTLIALGVRKHRVGIVNLGLLIVSILIVVRFFDEDLSFLLRGLAFIGVGIGFLVTNYWLLTRRRGEK